MKSSSSARFVTKHIRAIQKDIFAIIWIIFAAALALMTLFFKVYLRDMIVISIMFILFWFLEPVMYGMHGRSITSLLSRGQTVPKWKRFPLFFLEIILLYIIYAALQTVIESTLPASAVNFILVLLWVGFLFLLWQYYFSELKY